MMGVRLLSLAVALRLLPGQVAAFLPVRSVGIPSAGAAPRRRLLDAKTPASNFVLRSSTDNVTDADAVDTTLSKNKKDIRPLTQNWWPVSLVSTLDKSRPNPIELFDRKLVLWHEERDDGGGRWSCLDDRCAHRFAPLSEGRVVNDAASGSSCLQCSYHGWEFNGGGGCTRIPQAQNDNAKSSNLSSVRSYPTQVCAGMIWVWADPVTEPNESQGPSRYISNLLRRFTAGGSTGFQRDLPYGMEYLGENLVDISHLPFSHHSVGTLNRVDGRPVPLEMLSESEKANVAELQYYDRENLPLYQVKVVNAAEHDPEIVAALKYNPAVKAEADPKLANCTVGFFDPCHVRYHRNQGIPGSSYEINLFMCPTSEGNSRVFLFTPFEKTLPKEEPSDEATEQTAVKKEKGHSPGAVMRGTASKLFGRARPSFPPHIGHMIAHSIFDGDGIFLNKQGDRMRRDNLTYKDYHTPTSSDLLVNAFRRWLGKAAEVTRDAGEEKAAMAATGESDDNVYRDRPRAELLDRYASHTASCNLCQTALKGLKAKRDRLSLLSTALAGATGASGVMLACTSIFLLVARVLIKESASRGLVFSMSSTALFSSALAVAASWAGMKEATKRRSMLDEEIQRFYFEDYVHAEKN